MSLCFRHSFVFFRPSAGGLPKESRKYSHDVGLWVRTYTTHSFVLSICFCSNNTTARMFCLRPSPASTTHVLYRLSYTSVAGGCRPRSEAPCVRHQVLAMIIHWSCASYALTSRTKLGLLVSWLLPVISTHKLWLFVLVCTNVSQTLDYSSADCRWSANYRTYRHYGGNKHYSACRHYWSFPSMPSNCTGTIAGYRHYSTSTIEGQLLVCPSNARPMRHLTCKVEYHISRSGECAADLFHVIFV